VNNSKASNHVTCPNAPANISTTEFPFFKLHVIKQRGFQILNWGYASDFCSQYYIESVYKLDQLPFSVIPACPPDSRRACPESFFKKDSRRASLAGMTNKFSLWPDSMSRLYVL
jgi:hypothetical protein